MFLLRDAPVSRRFLPLSLAPASAGAFFPKPLKTSMRKTASRAEYQVSIADFSVWARRVSCFFHRKQIGLARMEKIVILCFLVAIIGLLAELSTAQSWQ